MQQLKCENDALKQQNNQLQQSQHELQSTQKITQTELDNVTKKLETVSAELIIVNNTVVQKTESQQHWQQEFEKIDASREEQSKIIIDLQTQNSVLNLQLATATKRIN